MKSTSPSMLLPIDIAGVRFKNPFFIASGPVSKVVEQLVRTEECGWGGSSIKLTIDPPPYINRKPRYGWWDDGTLAFTAEERLAFEDGLKLMDEGRKAVRDLILLANITYAGDKGVDGWVNMAKRFQDVGAHVVELNMCCPNMSYNLEVSGTGGGGPKTGASMGQNMDALKGVVSAVKDAIDVPLFVKLTPEGGRIAQMSKACFEAGADAVGGAANRLGIMPFDIYNPTQSPYSLQKEISMSCHCGAWLKPAGLRDTYEIRRLVGEGPCITATGGIENAEDAIRMVQAGGDLLGVCTAVIGYGFDILKDIMAGIHEYLAKVEQTTLRESRDAIVGALTTAPELTLYEGWADVTRARFGPCKVACPNYVPAQSYVVHVAEGRFREAFDAIMSSGPFQSVCGRVCSAPCEDACVRGDVEDPIAIRELKRFVIDTARREGWSPQTEKAASTGKKVAVIGSGVAGLTAAHFLATAGHDVTVFEKEAEPGGMMRYGILRFRLPLDEFEGEIDAIRALGVDIRCNQTFGVDVTADSLAADGYEAVLMASGAPLSSELNLPGDDGPRCLAALDFLKAAAMREPIKPGKRVAIIGGGFTAVDAARTALRMGADEVFILYRRTRDEMPATADEVEDAEHEGVRVMYLVSPTEFADADDHVKARMVNLVLGEPDADGRRRPVAIEGTEFSLALDTVIFAIGQRLDLDKVPEGMDVSSWGTVVCNDGSLATSRAGYFAAGDAVKGASTLIESIAQGKQVASEIDAHLMGEAATLPPWKLLEEVDREEVLAREAIPRAKRSMPSAGKAPVLRDGTLDAIECDERPETYTPDEAIAEAARCLRCGCGAGCSICADICNTFAIRLEGDEVIIDKETCHPCAICFQRCPSSCIEMVQGEKVYPGASAGGGECTLGSEICTDLPH